MLRHESSYEPACLTSHEKWPLPIGYLHDRPKLARNRTRKSHHARPANGEGRRQMQERDDQGGWSLKTLWHGSGRCGWRFASIVLVLCFCRGGLVVAGWGSREQVSDVMPRPCPPPPASDKRCDKPKKAGTIARIWSKARSRFQGWGSR